jgi:hypothetical protein
VCVDVEGEEGGCVVGEVCVCVDVVCVEREVCVCGCRGGGGRVRGGGECVCVYERQNMSRVGHIVRAYLVRPETNEQNNTHIHNTYTHIHRQTHAPPQRGPAPPRSPSPPTAFSTAPSAP